ncbi:MAG: ABC exporter membrane fusion protein [Cyanophyceae cyanobacterium]
MQNSLSQPFRQARWAIGLAIGSIAIAGAGVIYYTHSPSSSVPALPAETQPVKVTALGRLEPQGEVVQVSHPSHPSGVYRVEQLLVEVGDHVEAEQTIAILDNRERLEGAVQEAKEQVKIAQANLNQVQAGAQQGELDAQRATIARLEAQLAGDIRTQRTTIARLEAERQNAEVEYQRHLFLYQEGAISASALDSRSLTFQTAQEQVNEASAALERTNRTLQQQIQVAKATLARIAEVRPTNIAAARAEVDREIAAVARSQAELDAAYIRAPQAGRILQIHTDTGEAVGNQGVVDLGQTERMYAVAEVYEGDIGKIRIGQAATIIADTLSGNLRGTVEQIGWTIAKQDVLNTDPTAAIDARVVEVKIGLDEAASQRVAQLTNLQVDVEIEL